MLDVDQALEIVLAKTPRPEKTECRLNQARDHYLAEDVVADTDVPPFDRAVMDGYALRSGDVEAAPIVLQVIGESRAGTPPDFQVDFGQASRIMTGAVLPLGADAVQMAEKTESLNGGNSVRLLESVQYGANVAPRGHEVRKGSTVLRAGRYLGAAEIAVLATFGRARVPVWKKPTTAILATGDELVEVETRPSQAQIRNSNSYALFAQLQLLGIEADDLGMARDSQEDLRAKIGRGLGYDLFLLTGGVSMGKYDLVEGVLAEYGVEVLFEQVAIKPGKPVVFGCKGDHLIFGLPGNPVSSYVTFEYFVRPAIHRWSGGPAVGLQEVTAELTQSVTQKLGRTSFLPAWIVWDQGRWRVAVIPAKGSADITAFSRANSLLVFPKEQDHCEAGAGVRVLLLDDLFRRRNKP